MKNSPTEIRAAVDAWYDGTSTEEQDHLLEAYFSNTPTSELPKELLSTARLFGGYKSIAASRLPGAVVPVRRSVSKGWLYAIAAVAAVALLLIIAKPFVATQNSPDSQSQVLVQQTKKPQEIKKEVVENEVESVEETASVERAKSQEHSHPQVASEPVGFGYDYNGDNITDEKVAMESTEYFAYLEILNESFSIISNPK